MCVIAYVPKNINVDMGEAKNCFLHNNDGAGIMYQTPTGVHIVKGLMKLDEFLDELRKIPKGVDVVYHCRIATHGKVSKECTHPFPISAKMQDLKRLTMDADAGYAHNGILYDFAPKGGIGASHSDSMQFGVDILAPLYSMGVDLHNPIIDRLISGVAGSSRLAIMDKNEVTLIGSWKSSKSGIMYSNDSYEDYDTRWYKTYTNCGCSYLTPYNAPIKVKGGEDVSIKSGFQPSLVPDKDDELKVVLTFDVGYNDYVMLASKDDAEEAIGEALENYGFYVEAISVTETKPYGGAKAVVTCLCNRDMYDALSMKPGSSFLVEGFDVYGNDINFYPKVRTVIDTITGIVETAPVAEPKKQVVVKKEGK